MTDLNTQRPNLCFDESKSFADNCSAFLTHLESIDAEMASILRSNWDELVAIVREGERDSTARAKLNTNVVSALDALVAKPSEQKGGS